MKINIVKLGDIAEIQMGYSFREGLQNVENGQFPVIQMKDLQENFVDCGKLIRIEGVPVKEHHYVKRGDLLFRSRGQNNTSAILLKDLEKVLVSAPLLRIRITKPDLISAEYLNWYIHQSAAQKYFSARKAGTTIAMISSSDLVELEIPVPTLSTQKTILETAELLSREIAIQKKLIEKREKYVSLVLMKMIHGEGHASE